MSAIVTTQKQSTNAQRKDATKSIHIVQLEISLQICVSLRPEQASTVAQEESHSRGAQESVRLYGL